MTAAAPARDATAARTVRVFLLDDTRELRYRVRRALAASDGLQVVGEADDPVDGLPLIEDLQPDVVVCDLSMPRMDGLEAIPRIAEVAPDAGIVIFSGFLSRALGATALEIGADRYVEKSVPLAELAEAVRAVARARRAGERRPVGAAPPPPVPAPVVPEPPAAPVARAEGPDRPVADFVAELAALPRARLLAVSVAAWCVAAGASLLSDLPPSTFLVLWMTPAVALGSLTSRRVALPLVVAMSGAYGYCSWSLGTRTWYGALLGMLSASVTLVLVTDRLRAWIARRMALQDELAAGLQRSNAELEQFAYVASHDLAAPLRSISSFATMFAHRYEGRLDAEADKLLGFITGGTARMQRMIDDLLAFARASRADVEPAPFDLGAVVDAVCEDLAAEIAGRGARVAAGPLPELVGDRPRIGQVMQNLIANAVKFVPPDRTPLVEVSASRLPAAWRIDVRDNGIGIEPKHAARVFGMFQRLHGEEAFPGTGIGLAICQRIVERHGGRIWVDGVQGEGSTFSFTIPDQPPG